MTSTLSNHTRRGILGLIGAAWATPLLARKRVFSTVRTPLGSFTFELFPDRAPVTVANYLAYVDRGLLRGATVYRVVGPANQAKARVPIEVVQWGRDDPPGATPPLPPIVHEPTGLTGLRHLDGTVSMARLGPGTAAAEMFVCVGDQPALDQGGRRNPDGLGFAAFGRLTRGYDTIRRLADLATPTERLNPPIPITSVTHN